MNDPEAVDILLADVENLSTPDEVASLLRVTPVTVNKWIRQGDLKAFTIGRRVNRIPKEGLRDFLLHADAVEGTVE